MTDLDNSLGVKSGVFKRDGNRHFRLVQKLTMGEAGFNQFQRLRNQRVIGAENFGRKEDLSLLLISTMSNDMNEQLKLAHKVVDVVDRGRKSICMILLRYNMDK